MPDLDSDSLDDRDDGGGEKDGFIEKAEEALESVGDALGVLADGVAEKAQHFADTAADKFQDLTGSETGSAGTADDDSDESS